jgi:hypothetical protein
MRARLVPVLSLCLISCLYPPRANRDALPGLSGPPALRVRFDSVLAAAHVSWQRSPDTGFLRYELERRAPGDSTVVAVLDDINDTTYVDPGLQGDVEYRYRVTAYLDRNGSPVAVPSGISTGGIHRRAGSWLTDDGSGAFLPTRLVVSPEGLLYVAGIGRGVVLRYDGSGHLQATLPYTSERLALLAAAGLDGPCLAVSSRGDLYVACTLLGDRGAVTAQWSRFDAAGRLVWTRPLPLPVVRLIFVDQQDHVHVSSATQSLEFDRDGQPAGTRRLLPPELISSVRLWGGRVAALVQPLQTGDATGLAPRLQVYREWGKPAVDRAIGRDPISVDDRGDGVLEQPTDFAIDAASDRFFVLDAGRQRVEVFRRGEFLTRWGSRGDADGQFHLTGVVEVVDDLSTGASRPRSVPAGGIARDAEGFVYIADTFNRRIQRFGP